MQLKDEELYETCLKIAKTIDESASLSARLVKTLISSIINLDSTTFIPIVLVTLNFSISHRKRKIISRFKSGESIEDLEFSIITVILQEQTCDLIMNGFNKVKNFGSNLELTDEENYIFDVIVSASLSNQKSEDFDISKLTDILKKDNGDKNE